MVAPSGGQMLEGALGGGTKWWPDARRGTRWWHRRWYGLGGGTNGTGGQRGTLARAGPACSLPALELLWRCSGGEGLAIGDHPRREAVLAFACW